jgi:putative dimethyl sulfoxide reductase chaperone
MERIESMETIETETGAVTPVDRANAYHVLARALDRPSDWQQDFATTLVDAFEALGEDLVSPAREAADLAVTGETGLEQVAVAHAKLFVGPFEIAAAPWATFYLDPEQRLMGPATLYAAGAYAEAGLGPGDGPKDAPDHVTHELEFMYYLAFQEATTDDPVWVERQQRFWGDHLGRWLPEFAGAIRRADAHPFYQALADLLSVFCEREDAALTP